MKKFLLFATLIGCFASSGAFQFELAPVTGNNPQARISRASDNDDFLVYGYSKDYYNGLGVGAVNTTLDVAIEVPAEVADSWKGNSLTKVRIALGPSSTTDIKIYLTEKLGSNSPIYTQSARLSKTEAWEEVKLTTPYKIEGKKFYIGYQIVTRSSNDYPIGVDGIPTSSALGDNIGINGSWTHIGSEYGNVCIEAIIEGDALPQNDVVVSNLMVPSYVAIEKPFSVTASVSNYGTADIKSLGAVCYVNGVIAENAKLTMSSATIAKGESAEVTIENLVCDKLGSGIPVSVEFDKVNGKNDDAPYNNKGESTTTCATTVYPRKVVIEEWTGTWCPWCVRGIVGMEYMNNTYGEDGFIGIAVHSGDEMQISSYSGFLQRYASNYPGCIVNRQISGDANQQFMELNYLNIVKDPTIMEINVDAYYDENDKSKIYIDSKVNFAIDNDKATYRLGFGIIENNVGPYNQQNAYAGGGSGVMGGWESKGVAVRTTFNDVARIIETWQGMPNTLPSAVVAGEEYTYSTSLSTSNVSNIDNCEVVALIVNSRNSAIENACKVKPHIQGENSVENLYDSDLKVSSVKGGILISGDYDSCRIFGIDGSLVRTTINEKEITLKEGIYIVRISDREGKTVVKKVMVR